MDADNRRYVRVPSSISIDFYSDNSNLSIFNRTLNISRTGAYFQTAQKVRPDSIITIALPLARAAQKFGKDKVECTAKVIRVEKYFAHRAGRFYGVGIQFIDMSVEDWKMILKTISTFTANGQTKSITTSEMDQEQVRRIMISERFSGELRREVKEHIKDIF